ncbi:hypothetical protein Btru_046899 [Bulinus truncatus]|nr:hypothetical protein Btru_046899 [Bulinus truncatus]
MLLSKMTSLRTQILLVIFCGVLPDLQCHHAYFMRFHPVCFENATIRGMVEFCPPPVADTVINFYQQSDRGKIKGCHLLPSHCEHANIGSLECVCSIDAPHQYQIVVKIPPRSFIESIFTMEVVESNRSTAESCAFHLRGGLGILCADNIRVDTQRSQMASDYSFPTQGSSLVIIVLMASATILKF